MLLFFAFFHLQAKTGKAKRQAAAGLTGYGYETAGGGAPARASVKLCTDTCTSAKDGSCDDGGSGSTFHSCALGTDCLDCGPRQSRGAPQASSAAGGVADGAGAESAAGEGGKTAATLCSDTCSTAKDGYCDDGGADALFFSCALGTDCTDCGERSSSGGGAAKKAKKKANSASFLMRGSADDYADDSWSTTGYAARAAPARVRGVVGEAGAREPRLVPPSFHPRHPSRHDDSAPWRYAPLRGVHTVKSAGETLAHVAAESGVPLPTLLALNGEAAPSAFPAGFPAGHEVLTDAKASGSVDALQLLVLGLRPGAVVLADWNGRSRAYVTATVTHVCHQRALVRIVPGSFPGELAGAREGGAEGGAGGSAASVAGRWVGVARIVMREALSCGTIRAELNAQRGKTEGTTSIAVVVATAAGARAPVAGEARVWIPGNLVYQDNDVLHDDRFEVNTHNAEKGNVAETLSVPCASIVRNDGGVAAAKRGEKAKRRLQRVQQSFAAFEALLRARAALDAAGVPFWLAGESQREWCVPRPRVPFRFTLFCLHLCFVSIVLRLPLSIAAAPSSAVPCARRSARPSLWLVRSLVPSIRLSLSHLSISPLLSLLFLAATFLLSASLFLIYLSLPSCLYCSSPPLPL